MKKEKPKQKIKGVQLYTCQLSLSQIIKRLEDKNGGYASKSNKKPKQLMKLNMELKEQSLYTYTYTYTYGTRMIILDSNSPLWELKARFKC